MISLKITDVIAVLLLCIVAPLYAKDNSTDQQASFNQQDLQKLAEVLGQLKIDQIFQSGLQNLIILDRDDIERTGLSDLAEVIRQLPAVTGSPISTRSNRELGNLNRNGVFQPNTRGADGSTRTDLRGLGSGRTLVLIDGRRDISNGDFSLIPLNLVERIEVLQQGASANYGADAVGGVVNIITRQYFEGVELQVQYGQSFGLIDNPAAQFNSAFTGSKGDAGRISGIYGWRHKHGNLVVGAEYNDQSGVFQGSINNPAINSVIDILDPDDLATAGFTGSLNTDVDGDGIPGVTDTGGSTAGIGGFFCTESQGPGCVNPSTFDAETGMLRAFNSQTDLFNNAQYNLIQTPFERTNLFINSEYQFSEYIAAHVYGRYALRESSQEFPPPALLSGFGNFFVTGAEDFVFVVPDLGNNPFNPFGENLADVRGRLTEVRTFEEQRFEQFTVGVGFNGNFGKGLNSWQWHANGSFGKLNQTGNAGITINSSLLAFGISNAFIDDAGIARCISFGVIVENCTPANIFNGFNNITDEQRPLSEGFGGIDIAPTPEVNDELYTVNAGLSGGLFTLSSGVVSAAVGYEYRQQYHDTQTGRPICGSCFTEFNFFGSFQRGRFDVHSGYAEVNVPLLKDQWAAKSLGITAAVRYDDHSITNANTTFKANINWKISGQFGLRGHYAEVFREPADSELFLAQSDAFPEFLDACRSSGSVFGSSFNSFAGLTPEQQQQCLDSGVVITGMDLDGNPLTFDQTNAQPRSLVGGNFNLDQETGESFSLGVAFTPGALPGFSLSVDYWNIKLNNTIASPNPESIVNNCVFGDINRFCDLIERQSGGGVGEISRIFATLNNDGRESADGIDLAARYHFGSTIGQFNAAFLLTWLNKRRTASFDLENPVGENFSDSIDIAGTFSTSSNLQPAVFPEWKGLLTVDWELGAFGAALNLEYLSGVDEALSSSGGLVNRISSEIYVDMSMSYTLATGTEISGGITNIFDNDPPFIASGLNARTDTDTYRILGRSWFARLTQRF